MYKFFYCDYCEDKAIDANDAQTADLTQIAHSMDCVLHMPDNFFGIVNDRNQTLQFYVEKNRSIMADVPIVRDGNYVHSKQKKLDLATCLAMVRSLTGSEDFETLLDARH